MTAQEYLRTKLTDLKKPIGLEKPKGNEELIEAIYRLLLSKKFRKYSATEQLQEHIKSAIRLNVGNQQPINLTFTQGAYKLWRLEEAPEADWAELFAAMHYTRWLNPICQIYKPGVWLDFFVDDLILPKLNDISLEESNA